MLKRISEETVTRTNFILRNYKIDFSGAIYSDISSHNNSPSAAGKKMAQILQTATPFFMAAVAIILGLGLWNMARGGGNNLSQKLMRYRVLAQAVAVVVMIAAVYFNRT